MAGSRTKEPRDFFFKIYRYTPNFVVGCLFGWVLNLVLSFQMITEYLPYVFPAFVIATTGFFILSLKIPFGSGLTWQRKLRSTLFGIAIFSFFWAAFSYYRSVVFFAAGGYETEWVIGSKPYVYYPPEVVYGVFRSLFLAGFFALLERFVKSYENST